MCTVSFFKDENQVIITCNRDENIDRPLSIAPEGEYINGMKLFFPKDPQGGGSWFTVNEYGDAFVLLNGAEFGHIPALPYRKSRGIILLAIASALSFEAKWNNIDLNNIEPFTIVAYVKRKLIQVRWNGTAKEYDILKVTESHIWSSSTLYESEVIQQRANWFDKFVSCHNKILTVEDLIHFHTETQKEDTENGIIINRKGKILTKNITQYALESDHFELLHIDLIKQKETTIREQLI